MIVFPASENRTVLTFQPWMTWAFLLISALGFLFFYLPAKFAYDQRVQQTYQELRVMLTQQHEAGNLSEAFLIRAQEDLSLIGDPNYKENFPPVIHQRYQEVEKLPSPLETWLKRDIGGQLTYTFVPHHWILLLLACLCLPPLGFIFEHLYDRLILAALILFVAPVWVVLAPHLQPPFWPSITMSWSMTVATLIAAFFVNAPRSVVTLSWRLWFSRGFELRMNVPTLMFGAIYFSGLTLVNMQLENFQRFFAGEQLATAALFGGMLGLVIQLLPNRDQQLDANPEVLVNQQIARAETYFNEQLREKANTTLRELLDLDPDLSQTRRIADLAWEHHQTELAERAYKSVLRKTLQTEDLSATLEIVENMAFHNLSVPDSVLLKTAELAIKDGRVDQVTKLIPYMADRPGIQSNDLLRIQERVAIKLFDEPVPDRESLFQLKLWFEDHDPQNGALAKIDHFLNQHASEAGLMGNYASSQQIHKHLPVAITAITHSHFQIQTPDRSEKRIPWTAVLGYFGCQLKDEHRFLGAVFVQFKRKIFACQFSNPDIQVKSDNGMLESFPAAWRQLLAQGGPQIPAIELSDFETLADETHFRSAAESFIKKHLG